MPAENITRLVGRPDRGQQARLLARLVGENDALDAETRKVAFDELDHLELGPPAPY